MEEIQGGKGRAAYGVQVVENLAARLTERYGNGFSTTNLKYFRLFYQAYPDRIKAIRHPVGAESIGGRISRPQGVDSIVKFVCFAGNGITTANTGFSDERLI